MIRRLELDIKKYAVCFATFKKDYAGNPKLAMKLAGQFDYHLKLDMINKGLRLGARIGTGSYGTTFKATGTKSVKGPLCVKIPINLESQ